MKTWLFTIAGLIIFVGLALLVQNRIQSTSEHFDQALKTVNQALIRHQWDQTLKNLEAIKRRWQKTKPTWAMLIHHREIDSIDQTLIRTIKATQSKDYSQAQMELGSLKHYIEHIPEREKFNLVNIL